MLGGRDAAPVARIAGIPASTMQSIMQGTIPRADNAVKLARALGCTVEWLITGEGDLPKAPVSAKDAPGLKELGGSYSLSGGSNDIVRLPLTAELGEGPSAGQAIIGQVAIPRSQLARLPGLRADIWLTELPSNTMGDLCAQGDLLVCQGADRTFTERGVYVVKIHGSPDVRRVKRTSEGLQLSADHPDVEPIWAFMDGPDGTGATVTIYARVVGAIRVTPAS